MYILFVGRIFHTQSPLINLFLYLKLITKLCFNKTFRTSKRKKPQNTYHYHNSFQKRGSLSEDRNMLYEPKSIHSAPVTPCDSEVSWSDRTWTSKQSYEASTSGYDSEGWWWKRCSDVRREPQSEGVWWWRRPLDVRRTQCHRCGASSSTRPLRMMPCAGVAQEEEYGARRPLMSRDRPLLFVRQLFL